MAPVAAALCAAFIIFLLWRDVKRRPMLSPAIWVPSFLVFTIASRSPARWLELDNPIIDQAYIALIIAISLGILFLRGMNWGKFIAGNPAVMLMYCFFTVSFLWSEFPADSLTRALKDFGETVIVILLIFSEKDPNEAIRAVYVRCAYVALPLSLLYTRFFTVGKSYSRSGVLSYVGVADQKNSFGEMLMVFMLALIWDHLETRRPGGKWLWSRMRWEYAALLGVGAWLVDVSQSKTSLTCLLIGVALISLRRQLGGGVITGIFAGALSLPFLIFFTQAFSSAFGPILNALGRDATFTGRTSIWQHISWTTTNPLIGAGFYNFWGTRAGTRIALAMSQNGEDYTLIPSGHNGYLDVYLDGGVIGCGLLIVMLVVSAKRIIRSYRRDSFCQIRFMFLIVAIVGNLTESFFARPTPLWFTTLLVAIESPFLKRDLGVLNTGQQLVGRATSRAPSESWRPAKEEDSVAGERSGGWGDGWRLPG
jgi:O-antigen ligase